MSKPGWNIQSIEEGFRKHGIPGAPQDCWEWPLSRDRGGYGRFTASNKTYRAHRASWLVHKGEIPEGLSVLHKCDNPACWNPDHLFLGTQTDNMKDAVSKGRHPGGASGYRRVTPDLAGRIKTLYGNLPIRAIARNLSISTSTVNRVLSTMSLARKWGRK